MMRGIDSRNEVDPSKLLRDTRSLGQRISDFFKDTLNATVLIIVLALVAYFIPVIAILLLFLGVFSFTFAVRHKQMLPFRLPKIAHTKDYNDIKPGQNVPYMSRGIAYFGNEMKSKEELWFANEDMRTHVLIFGSTGSGKTEALVSIAFNALIPGSGFIYVDGKGDNSLYAKIFSMVRSMGREDDLLLINFMTHSH